MLLNVLQLLFICILGYLLLKKSRQNLKIFYEKLPKLTALTHFCMMVEKLFGKMSKSIVVSIPKHISLNRLQSRVPTEHFATQKVLTGAFRSTVFWELRIEKLFEFQFFLLHSLFQLCYH